MTDVVKTGIEHLRSLPINLRTLIANAIALGDPRRIFAWLIDALEPPRTSGRPIVFDDGGMNAPPLSKAFLASRRTRHPRR